MALNVKWVGGNQVYYDGVNTIMTIKKGSDGMLFNKVDCGASCEADAYTVGGSAGCDASFSSTVTGITVVKGIVTAVSGS